ncbi:MAG: 3-phosphoserine/phosphohydroxythreonine transaminase [Thiomicrorhabdus chilensis]|uniref:3-phosphoserine/phosphohydroxythreonine transaminase n=1 Tax=Thiomicrorhabdus chilensis TaxID=63656 RepID=UPI00299E18FB|nr:3-phosphoserine/phosphohydroxythreonine transaminase [Thiomicrorhabdus chilensis]MDX1348157.1 3-phosphoserine/phosphohydroxythreonine transaminase [Thiomicrorhabdus chilensis]
MTRAYNFSAGPAMLPEPVMRKAADEFLDWNQTGMSVMEMSHRSKEYMQVAHQMEADLREVMEIPDNYKVLFIHGGASLQFAGIPLNLTQPGDTVDYFNTGVWSTKAIKEASRYVNVNVVAEGGGNNPTAIPARSEWNFSPDAKYIHLCANETITGLEFQEDDLEAVFAQGKPVIADMSSNIMCRPIDVSKYALIYAGAQKNIGPAGLAIVIVREDLLSQARETTPTLLNWQTYADNESMFNTPATFAWYLAGLVFAWLKEIGGVKEIAKINQAKARKLYEFIDASEFYSNSIVPHNRSWMNVTFTLKNSELDGQFLEGSKSAGLLSLKGHKAFGGMRASIYNAMPEAGVDALIEFMREFAAKHA